MVEGAGGAAVWVGTETMINLLSNPDNRPRNLGFYATFVGAAFAFLLLFYVFTAERQKLPGQAKA